MKHQLEKPFNFAHHSHSVDIETTLDHDTIDNEWNYEMGSDNEAEEAVDTEWNVEGEDEEEVVLRVRVRPATVI